MSNHIRFMHKLNDFLFGKQSAVLSEADLQDTSRLGQKLDLFVKTPNGRQPDVDDNQPDKLASLPDVASLDNAIQESLDDLSSQVRKLAKTQFKANALQESQLTQHEATLEALQATVDQQNERLADLNRQRQLAIETAQFEMLKSLLPVLDGLDAAFKNGCRQVLRLPMEPHVRLATIAWLDGVRLARIRLLDMLAAHNVTPIPAIGRPFDPHRHVAVATDSNGRAPDGVIVSQDRVGYATSDKTLRFAEVVVSRAVSQRAKQIEQEKQSHE